MQFQSIYSPEPHSSTFNWVREYLMHHINEQKINLCSDLTEINTAKTRGRVQAHRELLIELDKLIKP